MIQRERAASGEAEAVSRPGGGCHAPAHLDRATGTGVTRGPVWEDFYRTISPEQQRELLSLAERQGVLYAHQLPAASNGTDADANRKLLARILGGAVAELQPLHAEPVEIGDSELDAVQREAVAKALATPDILLVQGRPGSGKSRVVAEIISCATARGERVLLLAPTAAAIDRILEMVASREVVFPVRCVDRDENVAGLPADIRALTFAERVRALSSRALECARRQAEADEQQARRHRQEEPLWVQMNELARQNEVLEEEYQALHRHRSLLAAEVADLADAAELTTAEGFARLVGDLIRAHQEAGVHVETCLTELRGRIEAGGQEQAVLDAEFHALEPLVEAKQQGRWWTGAWWRATIRGKSTKTRWTRLQERRQQIQADVDALHEQIAAVTREWEETKGAFTAKRTSLIAAEVARRQTDLNDREAAMLREQSVLQQKWQNACQGLAPESPRPTEMTAQAVLAAHTSWCRQAELAAAQQALGREWVSCLEQTPEVLTTRLPGYINLVAATTTALSQDEHFGDGVTGTVAPPDFDLLVLEEADQITEPEFLQAARRASRCVLIGETPWPDESAPQPHGPTAREHKAQTPERGAQSAKRSAPRSALRAPCSALPSSVFQHLWQHLQCDPRQLPYAWLQEANRLCCRLRQVAPEQRQWITTEHVADFTDIELRILSVPRCRPVLAEIVFPSSFSIDRAKRYIFQELEELAVQGSSSSLRWIEEADRLVLRLADRDLAHGLVIDLVPGIREMLGTVASDANGSRATAAAWQTCCLEFDRAAGWNRPRAVEWVKEYLGLRDLGRTIRLDVCYRMEASLAAFVSDLLSAGAFAGGGASPLIRIQGGERNGWAGSVEFVPVPALRDNAAAQAHRSGGAGQPGVPLGSRAPVLPRKGGAGLELDLSDPRHRDRLPAGLRPDLPNQGFVNYLEAQAVVRTLASLVQESRLRERGGEHELSTKQPAVAVLALYPAQAELIRRLMHQDATLAAFDNAVEISIPAAFRQREAAVVLLSLTRSHTHRAVAFGDGPQMLALAMTRARSKLVVFGDPGTLVRRSQWDGPLEHLDEDAAARERQLITRLVHCLQSCGSP